EEPAVSDGDDEPLAHGVNESHQRETVGAAAGLDSLEADRVARRLERRVQSTVRVPGDLRRIDERRVLAIEADADAAHRPGPGIDRDDRNAEAAAGEDRLTCGDVCAAENER